MSDLRTDEVLYSDLQVEVTGDIEIVLGVIREALVRSGAPSNTELCVEGTDHTIRIGAH